MLSGVIFLSEVAFADFDLRTFERRMDKALAPKEDRES
jgi:hypothetical protein